MIFFGLLATLAIGGFLGAMNNAQKQQAESKPKASTEQGIPAKPPVWNVPVEPPRPIARERMRGYAASQAREMAEAPASSANLEDEAASAGMRFDNSALRGGSQDASAVYAGGPMRDKTKDLDLQESKPIVVGSEVPAPETGMGGVEESKLETALRASFGPYETNWRMLNKAASAPGELASGKTEEFGVAHILSDTWHNPLPSKKRVSSKFGWRGNPFGKKKREFHSGMDFATKTGTPVYPARPGLVVFAGEKGGYGNMVVLEHRDGYRSKYAHLDEINVKRGQYLDRKIALGLSGNTGRSTGPHLHFSVQAPGTSGRYHDPVQFLPPSAT